MKSIVAWIKTNPITVASLAVMLLSIGVIGYFLFVANPALQQRAAEQPRQDLAAIKRYMSQSVTVPPANADDPPETHNSVTINEDFIQVISRIYDDLQRESTDIFDKALAINQPGHGVLVEGLFPTVDPGMRFQAKTRYTRALDTMMDDAEAAARLAEETGLRVPYVNAGLPIAREELQTRLDQQTAAMLQGSQGTTTSEARLEQQRKEQRRELMNMLLNHAQTIHLYAEPRLGNPQNPFPDFPLQIAALGRTPASPTPSELWEGQLELWILQDLMEAIAIANDVAGLREHGTDEEGNPIASSVLTAPIKRLLRAEVIPGYVGLHTTGSVNAVAEGGTSGGGNVASTPGAAAYPPPAGGMTDQSRDVPVTENYLIAPTGRVSNHLYDVRHVRLLVHADYQRLPEFFNVLSQVNLMTVLNMRVRAVDEYELLKQQYMYGRGDIVEAELIIETIWLREWTEPLMPDEVKRYLGLLAPLETENQVPGYGDFGGGGFGGPGAPGGYGPPGDYGQGY
jgi:hypothetical protein